MLLIDYTSCPWDADANDRTDPSSGSFGQKRRQAGKTPPAIPPTNEILPTLGKIAVAAAVQGI